MSLRSVRKQEVESVNQSAIGGYIMNKKLNILAITIAAAFVAAPAYATHPGSAGAIAGAAAGAIATGGNATGGNGYGGAGGQGGQGGNAVATGGEGGRGGAGGNASVLGSGNSSNVNTLGQQQGQAQGQMQGQAAISNSGGNHLSNGSSSSSGANSTSSSGGNTMTGGTQSATQANAVTVNGDTVTYQAQQRDPVASAWAAPLTSGSNTCMGSSSGGAQGVTFGVSFGTTWQDDNCNARFDAQALNSLGLRSAAIARLCQRTDNAKAIEAAGGKCPAQADTAKPTSAAEVATTSPFIN